MRGTWNRLFALATVGMLLLLGVALCGGTWLMALGGCWYYLAAGLAVLVVAPCLFRGNPVAPWLFTALLFETALDDYLRAYDLTTGKRLWESRLPAGGQATPMTYAGSDGRQYVTWWSPEATARSARRPATT